ncbi:periplasmic heavy metal sensor [Brevundimonas sp.]|uniref:periplasmic heavy metal sensor n=1 Tax=Brevundimonas sp. TaxID=1871086 RepID=UPI0025DDFDB0|nr:periplasmic heavy metal sensor [Brevundimonas sp.]
MSPRSLKIALAVSVTLNVFVVGAVAGGLIVGGRALQEHREVRAPVFALVRSLDAPEQERVRGALRESALAARSDFEAARAARLQAVELASAQTFDRAAVDAALERSHQAEGAGRRRLESTLLDVMADLDPAERQTLSLALVRRGPERGRRDGGRRHRERP